MAKPLGKMENPDNAQFVVVDEGGYDVATAYALLSGGTIPPVIRGDDVETL